MPAKKNTAKGKLEQQPWNYGPVITPEAPGTELRPHQQDPYNSPWVKAFAPWNNYFSELADKAANSPTHGSCVNSKAFFTAGDGFNLEFGKRSVKERKTAKTISDKDADVIDDLIDNASTFGDDLTDVCYNLARDYFITGNYYALLTISKADGQLRCYLDYRDATWCRVSKANDQGRIQRVGYSPDWRQENGNKDEFALEQYGRWPFWTTDKTSGTLAGAQGLDILTANFKTAYSVVHIRNRVNKHYYYGLPDSLSCLIYQQVEGAIGEENIDELENGFMPNVLIQGVVNAAPQEKKDFFDAIDKTFTRAGAGKKKSRIFKNLVSNEKALLQVDKLGELPKEGAYLELSDLAAQKIMTANRWHPILASVQTSGKLGQSQETMQIVQMAQSTVIAPVQNKMVENVLSRYVKLNGIENYWLSIANVSPVSFAGKLSPGSVLTTNEQRGELGYADLDEAGMQQLQNEKKAKQPDAPDNSKPSDPKAAD